MAGFANLGKNEMLDVDLKYSFFPKINDFLFKNDVLV